jgi:hypothetical protein
MNPEWFIVAFRRESGIVQAAATTNQRRAEEDLNV